MAAVTIAEHFVHAAVASLGARSWLFVVVHIFLLWLIIFLEYSTIAQLW
jgi:hypothetical protein